MDTVLEQCEALKEVELPLVDDLCQAIPVLGICTKLLFPYRF
jgi:hypothetical protein